MTHTLSNWRHWERDWVLRPDPRIVSTFYGLGHLLIGIKCRSEILLADKGTLNYSILRNRASPKLLQ